MGNDKNILDTMNSLQREWAEDTLKLLDNVSNDQIAWERRCLKVERINRRLIRTLKKAHKVLGGLPVPVEHIVEVGPVLADINKEIENEQSGKDGGPEKG